MFSLDVGMYAILISFVVGVIVMPILIPVLRKLKFGQNVRDDGPQSHLAKAGTPTMGGIGIVVAIAVGSVFFIRKNPDGLVVLLTVIGFGLVGFLDDYIKVVKKRSLGLKAKQKLAAQLIITILFYFYIIRNTDLPTSIYIPFTGKLVDLGWVYIPLLFIGMLGTVNGVNLTDGVDGLASGVTIIVSMFLLFTSWAAGSGVMPVSGAVIGALMAFLIFNSYPAKVFMGDTGSLALGGYVAATAFLIKMPIIILLIGVIYVIETVSVMIQVSYYKRTKKRVFRMAPIHHHFELGGWSETKVVAVFSIITALGCMAAYLGCKNVF